MAEVDEAGTDVAGGAATSTRPPYSLISAENVQKAMRGLGAFLGPRGTFLPSLGDINRVDAVVSCSTVSSEIWIG